MDSICHIQIRVSGYVQGVNYRFSARRMAEEFHVNGFARNESDGSVYLEAEGTLEQLDKFIAWCKIGPPRASVDKVVVGNADVEGFESFVIIR